MAKTSSWLSSDRPGIWRDATVATYCPGRMAEHHKSKSMGGFNNPDGSHCNVMHNKDQQGFLQVVSLPHPILFCSLRQSNDKIEIWEILPGCWSDAFWSWPGWRESRCASRGISRRWSAPRSCPPCKYDFKYILVIYIYINLISSPPCRPRRSSWRPPWWS